MCCKVELQEMPELSLATWVAIAVAYGVAKVARIEWVRLAIITCSMTICITTVVRVCISLNVERRELVQQRWAQVQER